jgi:integrase
MDKHFTAGRFRHTVATAAVNSGTDKAAVSAFLNQKDPRTLKRFYATNSVVTKIPTPL